MKRDICPYCKQQKDYRAKCCRICYLLLIENSTNFCIDCGKQLRNKKSTRCQSCCQRGKLHYNYKINNKCIDCGEHLRDYTVIRCKKCFIKSITGKNNPNFKHGCCSKQYYCIDCGKEINYQTIIKGQGRCQSCSGKKRWQNKEFREKQIKLIFNGQILSPNNPEKLLIKLLTKILPKEYNFVGNGKIFIAGFVPDFVNCNGQKKIIELYGDYWHSREDAKKRDKRRLMTYKKQGYKTLIIWEHELKDMNKVKNKILEFNKTKWL